MSLGSSEIAEAVAPNAALVPKKKTSCLLIGAIVILFLLVVCAGAYWWYYRPITPVELTVEERQVVEEKVESLGADAGEPKYEKGLKEIVLTEREINGLINHNTALGDKLKLTFGTDEVHARLETGLDEDLPVIGGKELKARARFLVGEVDGRPSLVLDDLTVWGASLPNDWLGGLKGQDLLGQIFDGSGGVSGIAELRIEKGQLVIRLAE